MNRLISEQELLKYFDPREDWVVVQTIKAIPSAESKWIPVSERVPKCCGMYLVTRKIYEYPDTEPIIMTDESWFDGTNTWHNDNRINHDRKYLTDVIAWMPLPKPYEPQEISYVVEQDLNEYTGNIEIIEKKY